MRAVVVVADDDVKRAQMLAPLHRADQRYIIVQNVEQWDFCDAGHRLGSVVSIVVFSSKCLIFFQTMTKEVGKLGNTLV